VADVLGINLITICPELGAMKGKVLKSAQMSFAPMQQRMGKTSVTATLMFTSFDMPPKEALRTWIPDCMLPVLLLPTEVCTILT
jgi:hypothetical protein